MSHVFARAKVQGERMNVNLKRIFSHAPGSIFTKAALDKFSHDPGVEDDWCINEYHFSVNIYLGEGEAKIDIAIEWLFGFMLGQGHPHNVTYRTWRWKEDRLRLKT